MILALKLLISLVRVWDSGRARGTASCLFWEATDRALTSVFFGTHQTPRSLRCGASPAVMLTGSHQEYLGCSSRICSATLAPTPVKSRHKIGGMGSTRQRTAMSCATF